MRIEGDTKMKKLIAIMLALLMIIGMAACTKKETSTGGDTNKPEEKKVITVSMSPDFAPMEFVDTTKEGQDKFVGFDVSLAKFIAAELGAELEIKPMSFDAWMAAVQTGTVDMSISGFSYKPDRAENFELSDYYYAGDNESVQTIIVLKENEGKWTKVEDYKGKTVAAQTASLQLDLVTNQLPEATVKIFTDIGTAVEALRNGNVDAVAVAEGNGKAIIANNDKIGMSGFLFEVSEESENNVVLIKKGNKELLDQVNACLAKAYSQGLYAGWYEDAQKLAGIDTSKEVGYDDSGKETK
jgi:polar amino acid transport system substrate-binding protein